MQRAWVAVFTEGHTREFARRLGDRGYLTPHRSKVFLLAAPVEPGLSETISADAVVRIIRLLREAFKYVIIDTPPSFTDHVLAALDESNECILITSMDVPSITRPC